ncbi:MAG: sigma 54-interacting transcriptional regulator [Candidatus Fermentithermobacillus carboniphilus]|uniref:Sigma 54-interacting transcriptional regulator n=1 Tax=Candidatus Fermentithermobacillus carboniphilus TaxID=3085328 RepID=A0AAT9LCY3_9FIRM|nr:MAG: sigma 54-interacting transcriptional regulator [Candidatus Fermentithermobacillus carboniphilus]
MTRLDRVRAYVEEQCKELLERGQEPGVDARTVAEALRICRTDASTELNKLWRQGILEKVGKKPVRYMPAEVFHKFFVTSGQKSPAPSLLPAGVRAFSRKGEEKTIPKPETATGSQGTPSSGDSAFDGIIGSNGSLKAQIQLAKAAVSYPPYGLHTLIIGETGVGKSLLAEAMWRYGVESGVFRSSDKKTEAPFVIFSCADYAENPQLLVSQLFGHVKGAFTGANEDKDGLVDRAQGGILFLDEIHRLPPSGQELLFTLIDKGIYRRLGDTRERTANLMIIGATSEDPQSALLTTFRRRIPVQIELPKLKDRPLHERLSLIIHFISQESNRLGLPVSFSGRALKLFMAYDCPGNIGDLRNDLQLCCAKSYLSYLASQGSFSGGQEGSSGEAVSTGPAGPARHQILFVDIDAVPQKVYSAAQDIDLSDDPYISQVLSEGIVVYPGQKPAFRAIVDDYQLPVDLYEFVERRLRTYKAANLSQHEVETRVGEDLEKYFYATVWALHGDQPENVRSGIIAPNIWNLAVSILDTASTRLGRNYSRTILAALALHLQQFLQRTKAGQIIYNPRLKYIQAEHSTEFQIAKDLVPKISYTLGVSVPEDETGFLAMFLAQPVGKEKKSRVGLVVAAHGRTTASSMADVANTLLGTNHIRAVDAPLTKSLPEMFEDLARVVSESDQGKGVLILADMGSFLEMEEDIYNRTGIRCKIIPNVTTVLVLEAGKVVMTSDGTLEQVAAEVMRDHKNLLESFYVPESDSKNGTTDRGQRNKVSRPGMGGESDYSQDTRNAGSRGAIITVCPTGAGTARKIREILLKNLPISRTMDIIPVSILDHVSEIADSLGKRLHLVVGSVDPGISGVPFVPVDEVLREDGLKKIDVLLKGWNAPGKMPNLPEKGASRQEALDLLRAQMNKFVSSLPASEVIKECDRILDGLEKGLYKKELPVDVVVRIYLHGACMFDRLATGQPLVMPKLAADAKQEKSPEFEFLKHLLSDCASAFGLTVPEGEVFYFLVTLPQADEV